MSRKKRRDKKVKRTSPSSQRYARRKRALSSIPLVQTGLGNGETAARMYKAIVEMMASMLEQIPSEYHSGFKHVPKMRRDFAGFLADRMFCVGSLIKDVFPRFFPCIGIDSKGLVVKWSGMKSVSTPLGLHFLPRFGVPVQYRGIDFEVRYTTHAIERVLLRAQKVPESWHAHDRTYRRINLQTGALIPWEVKGELHGFALWDATPNDLDDDYSPEPHRVDEQFPKIEDKSTPKFDVWRLVGYLPCDIDRSTAVAKTLLYPGMRNTPEANSGLDEALTELNAAELSKLEEAQQYELVKNLHECTPQFRRFTDEEALAAGNKWVANARKNKQRRYDFAERRRSAMFHKMDLELTKRRIG